MSYKKLDIYKKSHELVLNIHKMSLLLPKFELYEEGSQIRKSIKSVKSCIVEGYGRQSKKELRQFVNIPLGSLAETRYLLYFSSRLDYLQAKQSAVLNDLAEQVGRLLWRF